MRAARTAAGIDYLAILTLTHPVNSIGSAVAVLIGYLIAAWTHDLPVLYGDLFGAALATGLIAAGGFIVNDILDIPVDRVNRPDRPLAAGRLSVPFAWTLYWTVTLSGILLALLVGPLNGLVALGIALLLFLYSLDLKRRLLVGHIAIALMGAALLPFGVLAAGGPGLPVLYSVALVFPAFVAREILKTVPDYAGDRAFKIDNLATRFSPLFALRTTKLILLPTILTLPLLMLVWPLNILYPVVVMVGVWPLMFYALSTATPDNARALAAMSKLLFLLTAVALLIGSLPVLR
jgi:geranylgeranylglycerol-phosphate geranylgeranyltransferase